jgi:tripartite-type tricarboxylate transporter receptor subunit TctC
MRRESQKKLDLTNWRLQVIFGLAVISFTLPGAIAMAAEYPEKEISFVVPFAPGGGTDVIARYIANALRNELGKPVSVMNKPGAGGVAGLRSVSTSKPDGYTIAINSTSMILQKYVNINYVDRAQIEPIAMINSDPSAFTVRMDAPWKTINEALAWAKENPEKMTVANGGAGATFHICAAILEKRAKVKFTHVPFNGSNPAALAVAGHHVEATSISPAELKFLVDAGKLRILAISTEKRDPMFPNVPTYKESGIDFVAGLWRGVVAPKGTPKPIVAKLAESIKKIVNSAEYKQFLDKGGYGWAYQGTQEFAATMASDDEEFSRIVPGLGIKKQ